MANRVPCHGQSVCSEMAVFNPGATGRFCVFHKKCVLFQSLYFPGDFGLETLCEGRLLGGCKASAGRSCREESQERPRLAGNDGAAPLGRAGS